MKKIIVLSFIAAAIPFAARSQRQVMMERMWQHAYTLSADSMQGRQTGTVYAAKAADYICRQLKGMGAPSYTDSTYYFPIYYWNSEGKNVMALIPGSDPVLKDEYLIIGAHYDHIGTRSGGGDTIFNGADDNASGVTVLLEVTRTLLQHPEALKRSVLIAFFDAEESGLHGSTYLAEHCICPIGKVKLMMSVDMVGYLQTSHFLKYVGTGTVKNGDAFIRSLPWEAPYGKVEVKKFENSVFTATDTRHFAELGCPTLYVTTGLKSPYHKVNDEASGLDFMGMTYVADHLTALITKAASDENFASSGRVADIHTSTNRNLFAFSLMYRGGNSHLNLVESELVGRRKYAFGLDAELHFMPAEKFEMGLSAGYHKIGSGYTLQKSYNAHTLFSQFRLQYNLMNTRELKMSVFVAPYYRYIFSSTFNYLDRNAELPRQDQIYQHHYGLSTGLSYTFGHFLLEYRYYFDFTPMLHEYYDINSRIPKDFCPTGYNRSYTIGFGYMF